MGILCWPPRDFWHASFYDISRAIIGWRKANIREEPDEGFSPEKAAELQHIIDIEKEKERMERDNS